MCGIIGQISFDKANGQLPALEKIKHRGPDGQGEWFSRQGNVYLGHTRLAILEPSPAGRQPMSDAQGRFTITFNGEIYNHLSLRCLLPGMRWRGGSDTETLLELLAAKGIGALPLLKGMFAFALHDHQHDTVLLVRDRFGIKPLWYRAESGSISFASEVRPLLKSGECMPTKAALAEYIGFGRMPASGELFTDLQAVPPGSWMKIHSNGIIDRHLWWTSAPTAAPQKQNHTLCARRVHQLLSTAIEEHLISDVGVGAFLSGGIDSSIVALVAGNLLGSRLKTFTVGFPQAAYDERKIALQVARAAGSEHCELEVKEDACLDWVQQAVQQLDLPSVDAINTYIVSKAVRETGLKVALSGLGGDELFGGYPSFKNVPQLSWLNILPVSLSKALVSLMPERFRQKLGNLPAFSQTDLAVAHRRFTAIRSLEAMGLGSGAPDVPAQTAQFDTMAAISWAEIQAYMIPMLLRDSDQMSMAVGLEIRVPFLDHQLVTAVLNMPARYKKGQGVKPLLVDAFLAALPAEVYNRPKQGFALPMDAWMRGPLAAFTNEGLLSAAELLGLAEPLLQKEKFDKKQLHWTRVWLWCILGHWLAKQKAATNYSHLYPVFGL